ncbi:otogelin-like protein isoform X2 [Maylandia zebra]|uniref:otogelin-like protein isoform X2 n=1 Tax=Maylandia zebra TaxID=106582 RepID=UPI00403D3499
MNLKWTVKRFLLMSFSVSHLLLLEGVQSRLSVAEGRPQRRANALRRKRDLLGEETYRPLLSEGTLSRSILHNYTARDSSSEYCGCLNGGWCQEGGVCDCAQFQALGDRCQIIPNQGQDRDGICRSWGQHHYETFDGIYFYFPGTCSYILAQDCHSTTPQYTVWVHNSRVCEGSVYLCPRALSLFFPNEEEIHISGYRVHQGGRRLSLPQTVGGVFIERLADYLLVKSVFGFSLAWDGGSGVYLKMSEEHQGAPCGLCGNFNNVAGDDLTTARGIRTDEPALFANSWAVDLAHERACPSVDLDFSGPCQSESDMDDAIEKCSALLFFPFLSCHENIDPNPFVASCVSDLCVSDDEETFCRALVEYTRACSHVGYPVREWRDSFPSCNDGCEESFVYRDCISCCPPTCTFEKECLGTNLHCLDGCYCPDGLILQNGTCIAASQCPCVYHGTSYVQGQVLQQGCSVCVCMGGVWNCTENNCTVECSVVGDVFVTTFDGRMFLQPGACQYVLAKSRSSSRFTITLQYTTCAEQVCIQSVTVVLDEDVSRQITLTREGEVIIGVNPAPALPYVDDAVEVRKLTSVFTQLKTGIGFRLHYDGRGGRVYVQLDSQWRGQTLGLCGTYNGNLRDDFLSPAGMIEGTPQLHASAWKVSSACVAPVNLPITDPCEMNQHNVFYASQCEVLLGTVFAPCHGYISPNIYQQQCRYQACRCGSSCLCTALAHYAYLCSKHGVNINFRSQVSECGVVCLGGMMYHSCVSSCGRSCRAMSSNETCTPDDCAEGCGCPDGSFYDDVRQRCVQLSQCHCYSMGGVSQPGEVTFSASGPCLCRNGKMECVPEEKEPDSIEVGECPEGKVYHSCTEQRGGVACAPTCRNLMLNLTCPPSTPCIPGCVCPSGLVLHQGECYYPENCPCSWLGLEYLPGETVETPCYKCVCHRGYFNCSYSPCPAVCTVYSDRHYHTFDGLEYDYHSDCQVYLLKSAGETEVSIVAQNKDCYESGIVCMKILVIHVGLTKIYFTDNSGNLSPSTVVGRGSEFELWKAGYYTVIHFSNQDLTILWDRKTTVHIRAGPQWKGLLSGLCGNFDSVTANDMTTSSHMEVSNAQTFGDSWALGQCESDYVLERPCEGDLGRQPYAKRECALLYSDVFAPCHNVVDVAWFYRNCLTDTCNCNRGGDCECLCTSIAAYAYKCCQQGVTIHWRSPSVCPYDCEYYNQELGDGPFSLVSAVYKDTMFGVNRTSSSVFPLVRERPGQLPAPGLLFNFMITAGLQKDRTSRVPMVSLESAERPNYFLVVSGRSRLQLEQWSRGVEFSRRATFIQHQGLILPGHTSFELVAQPGVFLTLTRTAARAQRYDTSQGFKASSSFTLEESTFVIPYRMMCEWRYQSCASPCVPTCSDPDATRCQFLPPVEGCFPRCPKNMVLDEVTRRCVYTEDCVSLPPTPTPFAYVTRSNRTTTAPLPIPTTTTTTSTTTTTTTTTRPTTTTTTTRATTTTSTTIRSTTTTATSTTTTPATTPSTTLATERVTTLLTPTSSTSPSATPTTIVSTTLTPTTPTESTTLRTTETTPTQTQTTTVTTTVTSATPSTVPTGATTAPSTTSRPSHTSPSIPTSTTITAPSTSPPHPTSPTLTPTTVVTTTSTSATFEPETTTKSTTTPQPPPADTTVATEATTPTDTPTTTAPPPTTIEPTTEPVTTEIVTSPATIPVTEETSTTHPFLLPTIPCTPPYSYRIDECVELICFNGELLLHNSSLHCRYNTTQPQCSLLGMPILVNTDPCCPQWQCPCRCTVMSDLRVITFDGNNVALYDNGSYILVNLPRETIIGTVEKCPTSQSVNSIRRTSPTGGTSGLCFKKLNITTSFYRIIINRLDRKVTVNYRPARLPFSRQSLYVEDTGSMYLIHTPGGISIQWYHSTGIMVLQYIAPNNTSVPTRGLCGCCDGNPEDDLKLPNGTVVRELGDMMIFLQAWRVHTTDETEHTRRVGDNCTTGDCSTCLSMLYQSAFTPCHGKVPPEQFCDIIWAGDLHYKDHQCDFLAAYVAVCYTHQVCINWRRHNFCPLRCPPGKEYQPCVSTCTSRTCLNRDYYEETTCSFIREECVCRSGTILHRADSPYCVTEDRCVCTDNEGNPRAPGEVWNGSARSCCLYKCMENGSVVAVEPDCSAVPTPLCEREGEYVLDVLEEGACCPKKICDCNMTICDSEAPPCDNGNRLVIGYSALSCCPEYRCECDPMACPPVSTPECREDQFLVEVRGQKSCCYSYLCVCESCIEPIPTCSNGEILAVDLNTTSSCCPQYHCVCDVNLCPQSSVSCAPGLSLVQTAIPGHCCPQHHCECQCEDSSFPICQVGEVLMEVPDSNTNCGCPQRTCQKAEVCLFQGVTVLGPGQSLVQYFEGELCYTVQCLHHKDPDSGYYAMEITSVNCSQKCGPHQVYVPSTDPQVCCGSCKNISCTFTNENGTTELFTAGSSWVENCTRYDCMETAVGAVILASGVVCPPFNDTECIQNGGVVQSYVDGCCRTCSGVGVLPFTVNPVTPTGSTNCDTGKEDGKTCKRVAIRTTIRKDDCRSNAPVTVYSCDGKCPSATIFNFNINSHARFCKCCRESGLQTRSVALYCSRNATVVEYNFQEPLDCSCQWN